MRSSRILVVAVLTLPIFAGIAAANNVVVANPDLKSPGSGLAKVEFDLSWDNSWRDSTNYDACWVFAKYSTDSGTNWNHATLSASGTNPAGFTVGTGTALDFVVPGDKKGAFIQRSASGTGTVANTDMQFVWNFTADGVSASKKARVKVFAIEMVYVPQGSFYVGDGSVSDVRGQFENGTSGAAFQITSEGELTLGGGGAGSLGNNNSTSMVGVTSYDDFNDTTSKTLPAAFPKGYKAFYMMKTEVSHRQYCDFLNTLTPAQQANMEDSSLNFNVNWRNFIKKTGSSPVFFGCDANENAGSATNANISLLNQTNDGEWVACNFIYPHRGEAFADWAALRPMTELEFEKACRGPLSPVAGEYAWGNTTLETQTTSMTGKSSVSETPNQGNCVISGCSPGGAYRCGCFADASSSRQNAGAGYYGALELSGNLYERTVRVGIAASRSFTDAPGDGVLSSSGYANESSWPGFVGGEVTGWELGHRGGTYNGDSLSARVSDRFWAGCGNNGLHYTIGFRAVRSAP